MRSVALLDGGLGQEIYRRARGVSSPLWSVAVMLEQPEVVTAVHADFIRAGAKTLTLNTYAATPTRLRKQGLHKQILAIHQQAFQALERAIDVTGVQVDIAACLPPLTASYQGQPARTFEDVRDEYATLVQLQAGADVFLIETMTNTLEAKAACAAASDLGKPYTVAFRLEANGRLKSGETLAEAVAAIKGYSPAAVMLNCCDPELVTDTMPELVTLYPIAGGYANAFKSVEAVASGGLVDTLEARPDISPEAYSAQVRQWLADGACVVGGCCEITPEHVRFMADALAGDFNFVRLSQLGLRSASEGH
ncbi:homocysteine S-methyltransferase family protein [Marinobacter panjinensis]|uniref:Homocysteine S-methyltransferase family protein n=1 Tax=Marinobacter panjinensis TaxID=2576384 RepID=A0A4U6R3A4_9GAMM|nr:homocysteine S-methyltransferase family protein [Marinobacter panjinensis]MCR8913400.1 homocysteine S-methyltransferase family protein [Marinobacter panjinensis]TKV67933.1 homocysteine S-methyltransferase family protein [Marinobacter panjinensis]